MAFLLAGLNVTVTSSFTAPLPCGKSTAITLDFSDAASDSDTTTASACMTAYVRCNRAQNLPQIEARRDFGRQIEEQLKPLLLMPKFPFSAHGRMCSTAHFAMNTFHRMMMHVALKSQAFGCHRWRPGPNASFVGNPEVMLNGPEKFSNRPNLGTITER
jgi:hypothetical protein